MNDAIVTFVTSELVDGEKVTYTKVFRLEFETEADFMQMLYNARTLETVQLHS